MESNPRLAAIREDLKVQITDLYASSGTILIIHPKNNVQFHPDFTQWLADTLKELLPEGVRGMVLPENVTNFNVLRPNTERMSYEEEELYMFGWNAAIKAIVELNK